MEKEQPIGALWIYQGQKGQYMRGKITINGVETQIICFTNQYKKEDKHPDWNILISKPREEQNAVTQENNNEMPTETDLSELENIPF